mgnify:CR=1 FL=1
MSEVNSQFKLYLSKLGIESLNSMQLEAIETIREKPETILISPTGSGKTLAFLLPLIDIIDAKLEQTQALILVPSRELALQIEQVFKQMGTGLKINAVYGGRAMSKDKSDLKHPPAVLIGTPGRVADHLRREQISTDHIKTLILDEYDKSLEVGFEKEMAEIVLALEQLNKKILTSATEAKEYPKFLSLKSLDSVRFKNEQKSQLKVKVIESSIENKMEVLFQLLCSQGADNGIVFCNLKDSLIDLSAFLHSKKMQHACFFGGMEQSDRETALLQFRNGTHRLLLATDLASRGIDVPEMRFIVHFQLPLKPEEFVHRNGRTARMHQDGTAFILKNQAKALPEYVGFPEFIELQPAAIPKQTEWSTLLITGGRKDKISKGDIAGLFIKQGELDSDDIGLIELKQDVAYVAVPRRKAFALSQKLNNSKLKTKKVRITQLDEKSRLDIHTPIRRK